MEKSKQNPATCDCCEGVEALTPVALFNRPGLDAISYRVGTHASFLETMQARLSSSAFPQLATLTTRESRDASIALLDAWAMVGDVLTFYQERIANEGYLRTATERRSVLELARLVGYRLKPGLSASVYLAYTLEPTQDLTVIEIGNKAQSIPGPGELPQVFETAEKLVARSSLNVMKTRLTQPQIIKFNFQPLRQVTLLVKGTSSDLKVNDGLLLEVTLLNPGEVRGAFYRVSEVKPEPELDRTTVTLTVEGEPPAFIGTAVSLVEELIKVQAFVDKFKQLEAFGLATSTAVTVKKTLERLENLVQVMKAGDDIDDQIANVRNEIETLRPFLSAQYAFASARGWDKIAAWLLSLITDLNQLEISGDEQTSGQGTTPPAPQGLPSFVDLFKPFKLPQSVQPNGEANLVRPFANIFSARSEFAARMYSVINPQAAPFVESVLSNANFVESPLPSPKTNGFIQFTRAQALRTRAFIAGHNLPVVRNTGNGNNILPPNFDRYLQALEDALFPASPSNALNILALDGEYQQIKVGSRIAVRRPLVNDGGVVMTGFTVTTHTVQQATTSQLVFPDIDITFTVTVLTLDSAWLPQAEISRHLEHATLVRNTQVFAENQDLVLADMELSEDLSFQQPDLNPTIELDGFYPNLEPGRWTIICGERVVFDENTKKLINTGVVISELIMVASVAHEAKVVINGEPVEIKGEKLHTFLRPAQPPAYRYRRNTVKIFGNVVRATHGETRNEVLGSGDGGKALQSFQLLQPPLTYLPAPTPAGTETTLAVRVNDVLWSEADNLFALGPDVRKYITKTNDEGKTTVIFGDGEHGSRLPTGAENIKAVYRQGIGKGGNVKADQIKLPLTKPLGVKGVINPIPASGGVDKETRDQARRNAPIAVLALDRLVSVQDYADFARTFAGIAKASAQELSDGERAVVHLTIAGSGNIQIDVTSDLYRNLLAALARFGDPLQPLQVESFERVLLVISAKVNVLPEYLWEKVKEQMRALLFERLGFENRELGQSVTQSEVLSLMQSVPGVNYVDFDILDSVSEETLADPNFGAKLELKKRVNARLARMNAKRDDILPAQLVFLSRDAVDTLILEEVTV